VITVWWQYIIIVALLAAGGYGFVVLVRYMTQQMTRKTDRRAEDMYEEFSSARKDKDRWPI
jgi:Trk-type K+ transport system membrane component